ncbi:MAG: bifunctional diaminohydroxyphosphoribosylaminopyrimidine deaminase/5-amino-6-(5-phosphoribosylamino)uracil reductase RibD, partial [Chloroflexi bacterium]|nr:bifunctional diaminohydroxyphosphoribosylaminopyrimidine deaminase/5-amino-6-(5-phosphoribosylamino)uracil reductase RibD [Chloroflexota bacterium]
MERTVDEYMERALALARQALKHASPNPAVGAVLVKNGRIVGEGLTQPPGQDHAEKVALRQAGEAARGAALFVTLEPCNHFGRTPPCTTALIAAGIDEVHAATIDPNPLVAGRGLAELERAGIRVYIGQHEQEARRLNEAFFKYITTGLPFLIAKYAMTLDGKIATVTRDSRWVTGDAARERVHQLRAQCDAIVVGVGTVIADDPQLTARPNGKMAERQPLRVIVDSRGSIPPSAAVLNPELPGRTLIATTEQMPAERRSALESRRAEVLFLPEREGKVDLVALLRELSRREIISALLEGGGTLIASAFRAGLVDKVLA